MKSRTLALMVAAFTAVACSKEAPQTETPAPPPATTPATPAPITGKTNVVQMVGDAVAASGFRFEPATITIKQGDGIRFDGVSGGPHNVSIDGATVSAEAKAALIANMPSQDLGELSSKMILDNENYTISFANVPAGTYNVLCVPHASSNMKMTVTVTP